MVKTVLIVGGGLSGLTCGALLAKKGFKIKVIDAQQKMGGSCGIFKRKGTIFEQGAAMIYGFGEEGFNSHRFVFNALEEEIDVIKHEHLYAINYGEHRIIFYDDIERFIGELTKVFPNEEENFKRFYGDMENLYLKVIAGSPTYVSPDVLKKEEGFNQFKKYPKDYLRFLSYLNMSTEKLLKKYFKNEEVLKFFNKLTSTYCYTTVKETPAVLSSIMFVDNHHGGSYYPAGSTMNLVGKLEKVIEENDGELINGREVKRILIKNGRAVGVHLDSLENLYGDFVVSSANVWNLYNNLLRHTTSEKEKERVNKLIKTYPSVVLFAKVKKECIDKDALPLEMLVGSKDKIDEGELTVYILSLDDKTLCDEKYHTVMCIGPSFREWPKGYKNNYHNEEYRRMKKEEKERILDVLEKRFKGFKENIIHLEVSTPSSLERYALKEGGAVAGPKQTIGQHMLKRLHGKSKIKGLYHCGESTVMGTGTPAVTVSGVSAANLILRELNLEEYKYKEGMKNYVNIVHPPYIKKQEKEVVRLSKECEFCERPSCEKKCPNGVKIMGINRRVAVENYAGAKKLIGDNPCKDCEGHLCEKACIRNCYSTHVEIRKIIEKVDKM